MLHLTAALHFLPVIVLATASDGHAQTSIPSAVIERLESQVAMISGLEFRISVERQVLAAPRDVDDQLKFILDVDFIAPEEYVVRISGERFSQSMTQSLSVQQIGEAAFNGEKLFSGRPPNAALGEESMVTIDTANGRLEHAQNPGNPGRIFFWTYFEEAGFHLPSLPEEIGTGATSLILHLAKAGKLISWSVDSESESQHVILEARDPWSQLRMTPQQITAAIGHLKPESREYQTAALQAQVEWSKNLPTRRYRFLLDPGTGFSVREKWEETSDGRLLSHTKCEDFERIAGRDIWMPGKCRIVHYANENYPSIISPIPLYETISILTSVTEKTFSPKDFELWYDSPGGMVFDYTAAGATRGKPVSYQVPGDISDLKKASGQFSGSARTRWLIIVNVCICIAFLVALLLFRRRTRT